MARTKGYKLPKYLKLNKGVMWFDIYGENPSGVKLYAIDKQLTGRATTREQAIKEFEIAKNRESMLQDGRIREYNQYSESVELSEPQKDKDKDNRARKNEFGWVEMEDKSVFCTTDIDNEKLANIITAYKAGILIAHDPKKKTTTKVENSEQKKDFKYNNKGDIVFVGSNQAMFKKLHNLSQEKLILFIKQCGPSAKDNLMDLYHYEKKGYNSVSRARIDILDAILNKLNEFGPSMSSISVNDDID